MNIKHNLLTVFFVFKVILLAQSQITGIVLSDDNIPVNKVQIYNSTGGILTETNSKGYFKFSIDQEKMKVLFYSENFKLKELEVYKNNTSNLSVVLNSFSEELSEIQIKTRKRKIFELKRLKDVSDMSEGCNPYNVVTPIAKSEGEPDFYIVRHLSSMGEFDEDDLFDNKNCNVGQIFQNEMSKEEREGLFQMWGDNFEVIYSQFRTLVE